MMKKTLITASIKAFVPALACLTLLSACQNGQFFKKKTNDDQYQDINATAGAAVTPNGFIGYTDIPVPQGASMNLDKTLAFGTGDTWTGRLNQDVKQTLHETFDFYLREMPNFGWTPITAVRGDISVLTYYRGNRIATIAMEPRSFNGTSVELTVSPRGGFKSTTPQ